MWLTPRVLFSKTKADMHLFPDALLQVLESANSSLRSDDIVYIYRLRVGDIIEAEKVLRTGSEGNYRTKGEITQIDYMASHD